MSPGPLGRRPACYPRPADGFVLGGDEVLLERRGFFPAHAAEGGRVRCGRAGEDVAEVEFAALLGAVVGVPIVVHDVAEDGSGALAELSGPRPRLMSPRVTRGASSGRIAAEAPSCWAATQCCTVNHSWPAPAY